jgi:phosphoribosylformimino-5-aminoimidazole carboxamide ribotide isomerase
VLKRQQPEEGSAAPAGGATDASPTGAAHGAAAGAPTAIPAVDLLDGEVVRLRQGRYDAVERFAGDPAEAAAGFRRAGARWLHVVDLSAARSGARPPAHEQVVRRLVATDGLCVQLGGGLRSGADVRDALALGADRVLVGTLAVREPEAVGALARETGRVAVAADVAAGSVRAAGWLEDSGLGAVDFVRRLAAAGVRDFLVTGIDRDGTGTGPDLELLREVRPHVPGALIAAGGVGSAAHVRDAVEAGADAVVVGRALWAGDLTLGDALAAAASARQGARPAP